MIKKGEQKNHLIALSFYTAQKTNHVTKYGERGSNSENGAMCRTISPGQIQHHKHHKETRRTASPRPLLLYTNSFRYAFRREWTIIVLQSWIFPFSFHKSNITTEIFRFDSARSESLKCRGLGRFYMCICWSLSSSSVQKFNSQIIAPIRVFVRPTKVMIHYFALCQNVPTDWIFRANQIEFIVRLFRFTTRDLAKISDEYKTLPSRDEKNNRKKFLRFFTNEIIIDFIFIELNFVIC